MVLALNSGPLLEETHYYPYGLTMAGISTNALKGVNYSRNGKEFNGIEHTTDLDLNQYDAFYRTLDPRIGRWSQVDPKPNYMFSPYSAMAKNPILYSDVLGDTTWTYGIMGQFLGVVNDNLANQIHFLPNDDPNTPAFDASGLSAKDSKNLALAIRDMSTAFIGKNTIAKMKQIADKSDEVEIAFVGRIGDNREIQLDAMPIYQYNEPSGVDILEQVKKNYTSDQQADLFTFGHVHGLSVLGKGMSIGGTDLQRHKYLGDPTRDEDYQPALSRSGSANQPGRTAAILATPYGFTLYGTGTSWQSTMYGMQVENVTYVTEMNFYLYKQFKK